MIILIIFLLSWYLSLFSQTFFNHRYASHGAFRMSKFWERFFFIFSYITQGPHYLSPRAYAIMHRMHHAYTDTDKDPHSPNFSSNMLAMMWRTRNFYRDLTQNKIVVEERFLKNLPEWKTMDRIADSTLSRLIWSAAYLLFFIFFATSAWQYLLLPVMLGMGLFHGAIINWFAHKFGYINFKLKNTSRNLFRIDLLMLGESYHNNHHKRPSSVNFGVRKHEIDPVYPIILLFNWLHIVRINKLQPVQAMEGTVELPSIGTGKAARG
jgi:stearoyl-CoA desaturase (delta-9 desaturase)